MPTLFFVELVQIDLRPGIRFYYTRCTESCTFCNIELSTFIIIDLFSCFELEMHQLGMADPGKGLFMPFAPERPLARGVLENPDPPPRDLFPRSDDCWPGP